MEKDTKTIDEQIKKLEEEMTNPDFWSDKNKAQSILKEIESLKEKKEGVNKYDKGNAIITIKE